MQNKLKNPFIIIVLMMAAAFGFRYFLQQSLIKDGAGQSTQALFEANFPNEKGQPQSLKQYAGKIVVLNFWATWCEPCREEMPELSNLHDSYKNKNVVVLGVAIDDVGNINEFLKTTKISYPLFAADDLGMNLAASLGNNKSVLPYTLIIKPDGSIAKTYFGRVTKPLLEKTLAKLIQ
jgi:thiol-disulfide isomerase/thioredoxin